MKQYCKYCSNMACGDANYCSINGVCYTDKQISRANKCKYFDFNPMDALTGNIYKPRPKYPKQEQISFDEEERNEDEKATD